MLDGLTPLTRGRQVATVLGLAYTILGIVGFAVSGFDAFAAPRGDALTIFQVNPLQNLIHLVLGWWLVSAGFAGESRGRQAAIVASVLLGAIGMLGLLVFQGHRDLNFLNTNPAVDIAHLVSAGLAGVFLVIPTRSPTVSAEN